MRSVIAVFTRQRFTTMMAILLALGVAVSVSAKGRRLGPPWDQGD